MLMDLIDNVVSSEDHNNHHNNHHNHQRRRCYNNYSENGVVVGTDVNYNSPGHRSSLDGSFIQDEDMHLILDFGPPKSTTGDEKALPSAIGSDSWRGRNAELATDFDANVAQLDFDDYSTGDMMNLKGRRYVYDVDQQQTSNDAVETSDCNNRNNNNNNNINRILMRDSLDFSLALSGGSLFSSIDDVGDHHRERNDVTFDTTDDFLMNDKNILLNDRRNGGGLAFISADSLDISSLSTHEENLKAACATNKREYMLTFDNKIIESGINALASSSYVENNRDGTDSSKLSFVVGDRSTIKLYKRNSVEGLPTWARINELSSYSNVGKCVSLPNLRRTTSTLTSRKRFLTERTLNRTEQQIVIYDAASSSTEKSLDLPVFDVDKCLKIPEKTFHGSSGYSTANDSQQQQTGAGSVENNQTANYQPKFVLIDDYEYSEFYLNGRYIDVNHNEVGYVPPTPSSRMIPDDNVPPTTPVDDQRRRLPPLKPTRTFATLLNEKSINSTIASNCNYVRSRSSNNGRNFSDVVNDLKHSSTQIPTYLVDQSVQTVARDDGKLVTLVTTSNVSLTTSTEKPFYTSARASPQLKNSPFANYFLPDLSFLKFPFVVPALFPSAPPFPVAFLTNSIVDPSSALGLISLQQQQKTSHPPMPLASDHILSEKDFRIPDPPKFARRRHHRELCSSCNDDDEEEEKSCDDINTRRDSGLGSSGPLHIQDWESLATLLPKDVVQACSFFKMNSNLLHHKSDNSTAATVETMKQQHGFAKFRFSKYSRPISDTAVCRRCTCRAESSASRCCNDVPKTCCGSKFEPRCSCASSSHACRKTCCTYSQPVVHCNSHYSACSGGVCCSKLSHCCKQSATVQDCSDRVRRRHQREGYQPPQHPATANVRRKFFSPRSMPSDFSETTSDDDDDDEGDYCLPSYVRNTYSDYFTQRNAGGDDYSYFNDVPKFYSLQNVKELNDLYGQPVGYPLKRPKVVGGCCQCLNEMSSSKPCATCFRVRSPSAERRYHDFYCDCRTSDILEERKRHCNQCRPNIVQTTNIAERALKKLNEEEKAAQKTRIYRHKQEMVNRAVCVCDELITNLSRKPFQNQQYNSKTNDRRSLNVLALRSLCASIETIVGDGLLPGRTVWIVVQASATLGPATKSIHELVTDLKTTSDDYNSKGCSLKFSSFVRGLLRLRSLDCWLSYLVLKDKILRENYEENAFLQKSTSAYKTLFNRLIMGVQPLSMLTFDVAPSTIDGEANPSLNFVCNFDREVRVTFQTRRNDDVDEEEQKKYALIPTRLPSDSRIPKSSSVPSKLTAYNDFTPKSVSVDSGLTFGNYSKTSDNIKKSRIPLLKSSRSCPPTSKHQAQHEYNGKTFSDSVISMDASVFEEGSECDEFNADDGSKYVCAIDTVVSTLDGFLSFFKGETLVLVDELDNGYLRCRRDDAVGLVDRCKVTYVTFL